ncbi:hypothetical protein Pfo_004883 [Paulownia fortunei]|nr:hypothetical protein Pfo_004883 [Paulownia fortunei]
MAQETAKKKKSQLSSGKKATPNPNLWPNLPHQLIGLIARQPNLMQNITSFGCVTKTWRSSSRQCSKSRWPQLVEINGKHQGNGRSHIIEISFIEEYPFCYYKRRSYKKWCPIVVMGANMSDCCLWEPARHCTRYLPPWDPNLFFKVCTLTSSLEDCNNLNVMVLTGTCSPAFAFFRWGKDTDRAWTIKRKFYALSLQGSVVVIEEIDSCFRITAIGASRAVPSKVSRQFREYLVESDGEILLVFLVSRKSIDLVEDVEVFRLDIAKLLWVKVERLGDRTLFLEDECCMGVTASKVGCKKNCIYFNHHRVDKWWIFDMESGHISPAFGTNTEIQESVMWDEPMEVV